MRPLLLLAVLLAPSAAAALTAQEIKTRYLSFRTQSDRLREDEFPLELRRLAAPPVSAVQFGCSQPCADGASRDAYRGMLALAAERLALSPDEARRALEIYMPGGVPQLRTSAGRRDDPVLTAEARRRALVSTTRLAEALGRTQGPGDLLSSPGMSAGAFTRGTSLTREQLAALNALPGSQSPLLAFVRPGGIPATTRPQRLSELMGNEVSAYFTDPIMLRAAQCVLSGAQGMVAGGGFEGNGGLFGAMYSLRNDRARVIIASQDITMSHRPGYGGAAVAGDSGFSDYCRERGFPDVRLSQAQLADLDHFFFAAHVQTVPVAGAAMCGGGILFWDGAKPLLCNWFKEACRASIAYNWAQVRTGFQGCAYGSTIDKSSLGMRRSDI